MATGATTSAGTIMSVSATLPATEDASGYAALTWIPVAELTQIPEFGKVFELITHNPVADRKTYKFKGRYNNGNIAAQLGRDDDDAGQAVLVAAAAADAPIAFKVAYNDMPAVGGLTPTIDYFQALVMGHTSNVGDGNQVWGSSPQLEITGDIVNVPFTET